MDGNILSLLDMTENRCSLFKTDFIPLSALQSAGIQRVSLGNILNRLDSEYFELLMLAQSLVSEEQQGSLAGANNIIIACNALIGKHHQVSRE